MSLWPSSLPITSSPTPLISAKEAAEWRRSCRRTSGNPAAPRMPTHIFGTASNGAVLASLGKTRSVPSTGLIFSMIARIAAVMRMRRGPVLERGRRKNPVRRSTEAQVRSVISLLRAPDIAKSLMMAMP